MKMFVIFCYVNIVKNHYAYLYMRIVLFDNKITRSQIKKWRKIATFFRSFSFSLFIDFYLIAKITASNNRRTWKRKGGKIL